MPLHRIDSLDDTRLEPFREIRNRNWTERSGLFIAEGPQVVAEMVRSKYAVKSVLLDRKYERRYHAVVSPETDLLLVDHALVEQIVGYNFHRGVLGCGLRQPLLPVRESFGQCRNERETLLCVVGVQDPENLGGILRSCAGLGIERVIIGPGAADPLSRRVLRVSMGAALHLQLFRSRELAADLRWLSDSRGVASVAATLVDDAEPLERSQRRGPTVILVGNERYGLPAEIQAMADQRIRIAMNPGTDSLNVSVAAAIVMHYYCRIA